MALPTRDQLNEAVDRSFREFFPTAPQRLDPNDPQQAELVQSWVSIRDGVLNDWTDSTFFGYFPAYPRNEKLDPSKPEDAQLIDYWNDIHDQIRDGGPGRYNWDGAATAQAATATADAPAAPTAPATPAAGPSGLPDVHDPNFAEEFKLWAHRTLTVGHGGAAIVEVASFWAAGESVLAGIAEFTTPVGYALMLIDIFSEVIEAFGEGLKREENRGFMFGLLWETIGKPDGQWKSPGLNTLGLPDDPFHSDEEAAAAFYEGVQKGRAKANDPDVRYGLGMAIAGLMASQNISIEIAATVVLNELFQQIGHTRHEDLDYP